VEYIKAGKNEFVDLEDRQFNTIPWLDKDKVFRTCSTPEEMGVFEANGSVSNNKKKVDDLKNAEYWDK
jgi:hypothetical protein